MLQATNNTHVPLRVRSACFPNWSPLGGEPRPLLSAALHRYRRGELHWQLCRRFRQGKEDTDSAKEKQTSRLE